MEVEEVEGVLIPVVGWVAIVSVVVLLLGGVGLGIYIPSRYYVKLHYYYIRIKIPAPNVDPKADPTQQ